jgi:hypothetical protein
MKKLLLIIAIAHVANHTFAQNNVPDPSFESYVTCPTPIDTSVFLTDWFSPTSTSPDYFNACSNNIMGGIMGVPDNDWGLQAASSGNAYLGMYIIAGWFTPDYKDYISCKLGGCASGNCALVPGAYYRVSMDVSLAEEMSNTASDGIGVYFFTDTLPSSYKSSWTTTLPFTPKIDYSSLGMITDTVNWVTLTDTFQADSAYKYMVIGGVVQKQNLNFVRYKADNRPDVVYYYFDNIKVEPLSPTLVKSEILLKVVIAPNPIKDQAVIKLSGNTGSPYSISLTNMLGQTFWQRSEITENEITFERGALPAGLYYYQLSTKGQVAQKGKLVLE